MVNRKARKATRPARVDAKDETRVAARDRLAALGALQAASEHLDRGLTAVEELLEIARDQIPVGDVRDAVLEIGLRISNIAADQGFALDGIGEAVSAIPLPREDRASELARMFLTQLNEQNHNPDPLFDREEAWTFLACGRSKFEEMRKARIVPKPDSMLGRSPRWKRSTLDRVRDRLGRGGAS